MYSQPLAREVMSVMGFVFWGYCMGVIPVKAVVRKGFYPYDSSTRLSLLEQ